MLVTRQDIIILKNLSTTKELIAVDRIPSTFKKTFNFSFWKDFLKKDDTLFAYPHDIKKWTRFMFNKYNG
ncbi:hypothetical protein JJC04_10735 [Flavobacterium covae]|nr:hypothetical protein [Flavobacterium covae]QYS90541.1 hypothetical protein JJC04_10735 [Flavobacterium covae]